MKHLRKFNENSNRPGQNTGAKSITISNDEVDSFSTEPSLQKLIADEKVSVIGNKVYYNDDETKSILDEYLEIPGKVEEDLYYDEESEIFNIVKSHVNSNNEKLIREAIEEAGDVYVNSNSELIAFVEGYINAFCKYTEI